MISKETYYLGGPDTSNLTASGYYDAERSNNVYGSNPTSTTQYIGLMYPSDYGYAAGSSCLSTTLYDYDSNCKNSDYLFSGVTEWLQTPSSNNSASATNLNNGYVIPFGGITRSYAVRPSLYLSSETKITDGNGSQDNPFILEI